MPVTTEDSDVRAAVVPAETADGRAGGAPAAATKWLTRRRFVGFAAGGVVAAGGGFGYARWLEPYLPVITRRTMRLPRLHAELAGRRIVHLSDLHIGAGMPAAFFCEQMERVRALRPDLVLITGDFHTRPSPNEREELARVLRGLAAPLGVYACLGNHDYAAYMASARSWRERARMMGAAAESLLESAGVRLLRNSSRVIECGRGRLQIVGLEDVWSGLYDSEAAFARTDRSLPTVVLSHNPDSIADLQPRRCDLVLSGHTHGGQVRLPGVGALILPVRLRQYDMGHFRVGETQLYVNRGLGTLRRVRFNCRPEIAEFTLAA